MDIARARQIIQSSDRILIELDGSPVWIDGIDEDRRTATVHVEGQPQMRQTVAVDRLTEVH